MENSKTNYVCGFYFDDTFRQVVLIWKNKPAWQKGKLNGVGGKIEQGELPIIAMRREFYEETGILHNEWEDLITLSGNDWRVYFFCTIGKVNEFEYVESKEEEEVAKIEVDRLYGDYPHIPNLDWLVPMAINKLKFPEEFEEYAALRARNERMERALSRVVQSGAGYKYKSTIQVCKEALAFEPEQPTKLTPEQIQERKEAIEWIRNPGGMRWVTGEYDRLYEQLKDQPERKIPCFVDYNFPGDTTQPCRDICAIRGEQMEFSARGRCYGGDRDKEEFLKECERLHVEWLDEGKEVPDA